MAVFDYEGLKDAIADGLAEYLGRYTFRNGSSVQAITLDLGNQAYPPENAAVSGLEAVVLMNPEVPITEICGGYRETYSALVILRQWDQTQSITREIMNALRDTIDQWDYEVQQRDRVRLLRNAVNDLEQFRLTVAKELLHS